jgi:hypothetical protein
LNSMRFIVMFSRAQTREDKPHPVQADCISLAGLKSSKASRAN